jgi:subtilisin family serine protease
VAAPSEDLVGAGPGGDYYTWAGTSGATPIVSGLLALIIASHPGISAGNAINRLTATATPAGSAITYGNGLIDAAKAVTAAVPTVKTNPADELKEWIRLNRRAASSPLPASTATARPTPVPAVAAPPVSPFGSVLPSVGALRDVGLPLLVYLVFGGLLVLVVLGARRAVKRARRLQ